MKLVVQRKSFTPPRFYILKGIAVMKKGILSKRGYAPVVELLEDRTLLSGNVIASLNEINGLLTITGDIGNNAIHLSGYTNAGINYLRVQGDMVITPPAPPDFTTINGVSFTDFVYTSISSININMNTGIAGVNAGADKISIGTAGSFATPGTPLVGFQIPNNLTINLGTGQGLAPPSGAQSVSILGATTPLTPVITASTTTANIITITGGNATAGNGNENITLTNVTAGSVRVTTGTGNDSVSMTGANVGTVIINTGTAGNDTVSLTSSPGDTTPPLPRPAFGQVSITTAGCNDSITVGGGTAATAVTSGNVSIVAGDGNNTIKVGAGDTLKNLSITALNGNNTIDVGAAAPAPLTTLLAATIGTGNGVNTIRFRNSNITSASITNGTGNGTSIDFSNNTVTVAAGLVMSSNTPLLAAAANNTITIIGNTFTGGGAVTATIGDGNTYFTVPSPNNPNLAVIPTATFSSFVMTGDSGIGTATINLGRNFKTVTVGSDLATNVVNAANLTLNVNTGADIVNVNTNVPGTENITVLDMVTIPGGAAAGDFFPTPPTVSVAGTAGALGLTVGNGAKTVTQAATVTGTETVNIGNALTIALNLPTAVSILRPTAGASNITIGNNWNSISVTGADAVGSPNQLIASEVMVVGTGAGSITVSGSLSGNENLTIGDNFGSFNVSVSVGNDQTINAGNGSNGSATVSSSVGRDQFITIGNGNLSVTVTSPVVRDQTISVGAGNGAINISGGTRNELFTFGNGPRSVTISGAISGTHTVNLGNNITLNDTVVAPGGTIIQPTVPGGASGSVVTVGPVAGPALAEGPVTIVVGPSSAVTVQNLAITGALNVTMGDLAVSLFIFSSSVSTDLNVTMGLGIDGVSQTFVWMQNVIVGNDLTMNAGANGGNFTVYLVGLNILDQLTINLGAVAGGTNMVFAQNVECFFGNIDGGNSTSDIFFDLGGNLGFTTSGFEGLF